MDQVHPVAEDASPAPLVGEWGSTAAALGGWAALTVVAWAVAGPYRAVWKIRASPLTGFFDRHLTPVTVLVLVVGLALARWLPGWCLRVGWRRLLAGVAVLGLAWGLGLSLTRGPEALDRGLGNRHEYPAVVPVVDEMGVGPFIETFTTEAVLREQPIHIQGHPLGAALLFVGLDRIGLEGPAGAAVFLLAVSSTAIVAVLLSVREVAGEGRARRVAPFLVLMPGLVWWVTSADALFATVGAWAVTLLVLATSPARPPRQRALLAVGSGIAWGLGIHLTYGLPPLALVGLAVVASRRRWSVVPWVAVGAAIVVAGFVLVGFWWFDGLAATRIRYVAGVASVRSPWYFAFLGNPAAVGLALGPAVWVAVVRVRDRGLALLAYPALGAMLLADASGLSKAEVERIWLPFVPWVLTLTGGLVDRSQASRSLAVGAPAPARGAWAPPWPALASWLLVGQVLLAVSLESFVKTPW